MKKGGSHLPEDSCTFTLDVPDKEGMVDLGTSKCHE